MIDRKSKIDDINKLIIVASELDLRVGQLFSLVENMCIEKNKDLFLIENDELLEILETILD